MTTTPSPKLSIVIAAWNGPDALRACLASLGGQAETPGIEVVVAANFDAEAAAGAANISGLQVIARGPEATVPRLRAAGIAAARGDIVAVTEDHAVFDARWCAEISKAHESAHAAIGGSVENAGGQRALDWAVYFYDYGRYMPPNVSGETGSLSGFNVSYKRAALDELAPLIQDGFFEASVHSELVRRGHRLFLASPAVVFHNKRYRFGAAFAQSFHLARSFAGRRFTGAGKRLAYAAGSLLLPVLLPVRAAAQVISKRRRRKELILAMPYLVLLMTSWACGEFCGYLFGEGRSGEQWK